MHPRPSHYNCDHAIFTALQAIFSLLITALFNFLQIHYQSKSTSPFETHPLLFVAALLFLLLYSSLAVAHLINPAPWLRRPALMALLACLLVASLVSLLCHGGFYILLYTLPILALLSATPSRGFIHSLCRRVFPRFFVVFSGRRAPSPRLLPLTEADTRSPDQTVSRTCPRELQAMAARDPPRHYELQGLVLLVEASVATHDRFQLPILTSFPAISSAGFIHRFCTQGTLQVFSSRRAPQLLLLPLTLPLTDVNAHSSGICTDANHMMARCSNNADASRYVQKKGAKVLFLIQQAVDNAICPGMAAVTKLKNAWDVL